MNLFQYRLFQSSSEFKCVNCESTLPFDVNFQSSSEFKKKKEKSKVNT